MTASVDAVLQRLRAEGLRMTPQRRAIVSEVMAADGHITPTGVARRVRERVPGVDASTVYRTIELLERLGVEPHAHLESGAGYHRCGEGQHVHLACSRCGAEESLSMREAELLEQTIVLHHGFRPDFTHFAIAGVCARCQAEEPA